MSDILGSDWEVVIWSDANNTGNARKAANEKWKKLVEYVKNYIVKFVLKAPKMPVWRDDPARLGYLVTLVFSVALHGEEWPLQSVVLERLALEEEEGIKPVSTDLPT